MLLVMSFALKHGCDHFLQQSDFGLLVVQFASQSIFDSEAGFGEKIDFRSQEGEEMEFSNWQVGPLAPNHFEFQDERWSKKPTGFKK